MRSSMVSAGRAEMSGLGRTDHCSPGVYERIYVRVDVEVQSLGRSPEKEETRRRLVMIVIVRGVAWCGVGRRGRGTGDGDRDIGKTDRTRGDVDMCVLQEWGVTVRGREPGMKIQWYLGGGRENSREHKEEYTDSERNMYDSYERSQRDNRNNETLQGAGYSATLIREPEEQDVGERGRSAGLYEWERAHIRLRLIIYTERSENEDNVLLIFVFAIRILVHLQMPFPGRRMGGRVLRRHTAIILDLARRSSGQHELLPLQRTDVDIPDLDHRRERQDVRDELHVRCKGAHAVKARNDLDRYPSTRVHLHISTLKHAQQNIECDGLTC